MSERIAVQLGDFNDGRDQALITFAEDLQLPSHVAQSLWVRPVSFLGHLIPVSAQHGFCNAPGMETRSGRQIKRQSSAHFQRVSLRIRGFLQQR